MRNLCMIGAFPPPINGSAIAFETLAEANEIKSKFKIYKINFMEKKHFTGKREIIYKMFLNLHLISTFRKLVIKESIDIFYLCLSTSNRGSIRDSIIVDIIKRNAPSAKLIVHHHGGSFKSFYEGSSPRKKKIIKKYLNYADRVIVLTEKLSLMFKDIVPECKVKIVSNAVRDCDRLDNKRLDDKFALLKQKKCINIIYLSNMIKSKGYIKVLDAAVLLKKDDLKVNFTFAGEFKKSKEKDTYYQYIKKSHLENDVSYIGSVDGMDKKNLLFKGDIFVLPTLYPHEGQPISILEAMASGMPVVTTAQGGISDVIRNGINGIIVEECTSEQISYAIKYLVHNRDYIEMIGRNNIKEVEQKYVEKIYIQNMISIFMETAENEE